MKLLKNNYLAHSYLNSLLQYKEVFITVPQVGILDGFLYFHFDRNSKFYNLCDHLKVVWTKCQY